MKQLLAAADSIPFNQLPWQLVVLMDGSLTKLMAIVAWPSADGQPIAVALAGNSLATWPAV